MKLKHKIALFIVYLTVFAVISALIEYYAYFELPVWLFILFTILASIVSTLIHIKSKSKTKADELAKEIEEII